MSDSDHSEDEANLPSAAECQKAIDNFVQFTATDEALAQFYLQVFNKLDANSDFQSVDLQL
jgi:hypothetical protein